LYGGALLATLALRFAIAASATRSCSTAAMYFCTADIVAWPLTAMISGAVHPAWASCMHAAFRSPWAR